MGDFLNRRVRKALAKSGRTTLSAAKGGFRLVAATVSAIDGFTSAFSDNPSRRFGPIPWGFEPQREFRVAVAGESQVNEDGTARQQVIARCREGQPVNLIREPKNRYDSNAIRVRTLEDATIGYVNAENAYRLAQDIDGGRPVKAIIADINGGTGKKKLRGVVLWVAIGILLLLAA